MVKTVYPHKIVFIAGVVDVGIDELIQVCTGLNLSLCVRWLVPAVKPTDRAERRAAESESGGGRRV